MRVLRDTERESCSTGNDASVFRQGHCFALMQVLGSDRNWRQEEAEELMSLHDRIIWAWLVTCIGETVIAVILDRSHEYVLLVGIMIGGALSGIFGGPSDER
jgi:hypothetical protein